MYFSEDGVKKRLKLVKIFKPTRIIKKILTYQISKNKPISSFCKLQIKI